MTSLPVALVVGGSSGLGYDLAKMMLREYDVHITGRTSPLDDRMLFHSLNLTDEASRIQNNVVQLIARLPEISLLAYCAGAVQLGRLDTLSLSQIEDQISVGIIAPAIIMKEVLQHQERIETLLVITSTTQRIAREKEPVYATAKAALGMLAKSLSLDSRITRTLVAGPGGMKTKFWNDTGVNMDGFLEPSTVASQVISQLEGVYRYRHVEIPRTTGLAELVEERI